MSDRNLLPTPGILENHGSVEPQFDKNAVSLYSQPSFWKLAFVFWFSFPFNLSSCQRDHSPLPYSTASPDWIPLRAPRGIVLQADLREPFCLLHNIHLFEQLKLCYKMCATSWDLINTSSEGMGFNRGDIKHLNSTLRQQRLQEHGRQVIEIK